MPGRGPALGTGVPCGCSHGPGCFQELPGAAVPTLLPSGHGQTDTSRTIKEGRAGCGPPAVGTAPLRGGVSGMLHRIPYRVLGRGGARGGGGHGHPSPLSPPSREPRGGATVTGAAAPPGDCTDCHPLRPPRLHRRQAVPGAGWGPHGLRPRLTRLAQRESRTPPHTPQQRWGGSGWADGAPPLASPFSLSRTTA